MTDAVMRVLMGDLPVRNPKRKRDAASGDPIAAHLATNEPAFAGGHDFAAERGYSPAPPQPAAENMAHVAGDYGPLYDIGQAAANSMPGLFSYAGAPIVKWQHPEMSWGDALLEARRKVEEDRDVVRQRSPNLSGVVETTAPFLLPAVGGRALGSAKVAAPVFGGLGMAEGYMHRPDAAIDDPNRAKDAVSMGLLSAGLGVAGAKAPAIMEGIGRLPGKAARVWDNSIDAMIGRVEKGTEQGARAKSAFMQRDQIAARLDAEQGAYDARMAQEQAWNDIGTKIDEAARGRALREGMAPYGELEASDPIMRQLRGEYDQRFSTIEGRLNSQKEALETALAGRNSSTALGQHDAATLQAMAGAPQAAPKIDLPSQQAPTTLHSTGLAARQPNQTSAVPPADSVSRTLAEGNIGNELFGPLPPQTGSILSAKRWLQEVGDRQNIPTNARRAAEGTDAISRHLEEIGGGMPNASPLPVTRVQHADDMAGLNQRLDAISKHMKKGAETPPPGHLPDQPIHASGANRDQRGRMVRNADSWNDGLSREKWRAAGGSDAHMRLADKELDWQLQNGITDGGNLDSPVLINNAVADLNEAFRKAGLKAIDPAVLRSWVIGTVGEAKKLRARGLDYTEPKYRNRNGKERRLVGMPHTLGIAGGALAADPIMRALTQGQEAY